MPLRRRTAIRILIQSFVRQVGAEAAGSFESLLIPPFGDFRLVSGEKNVRDTPPCCSPRAANIQAEREDLSWNESERADCSSPITPGISLTTASAITAAGSSSACEHIVAY